MRYTASILVLILAGIAILAGLFVGQPAQVTTASVMTGDQVAMADESEQAGEATAVSTQGGGGSTATQSVESTEQEWLCVPGTGVALWPKPRS